MQQAVYPVMEGRVSSHRNIIRIELQHDYIETDRGHYDDWPVKSTTGRLDEFQSWIASDYQIKYDK
jgi:hypothetical protein